MSGPQFVTGDLWDEIGRAEVVAVTTNCTITQDGRLVMGRGAAAEMVARYPGIEYDFGRLLRDLGAEYWRPPNEPPPWEMKPYGFLVVGDSDARPVNTCLAIFQVKWHFRDKADLDLIRVSCQMLAQATAGQRVALNYPGIGYGQRQEEEVRPILEACLAPEVVVYRRAP